MNRLWLAALLSSSLMGCTVSTLDDGAGGAAKNDCDDNSDCGEGTCDLERHVCRAPKGTFSSLLLEVTPPSTSDYSGVRFLQKLENLSTEGGELNLDVGHAPVVSGTLQPTQADYQDGCVLLYGKDNSSTVPVKVTLTPSERVLGLPSSSYSTTVDSVNDEQEYEFNLQVPAGEYDVYVEPSAEWQRPDSFGDSSCTVVPQLHKRIVIEVADKVTLPLVAQPPTQLKVVVEWPAPGAAAQGSMPSSVESLGGWQVDLIDPGTGRVLSAQPGGELVPSSDPEAPSGPDVQVYEALVEFAPVVGDPNALNKELVRLRPPEGVIAPTLVLERGTLDPFNSGEARVKQPGAILPAVEVDGPLLGPSSNSLMDTTTVKFVAKELTGISDGVLFAFERTVEARDGKYSALLLPGEYDVYITPPLGLGLATTHTTLAVAKDQPKQGGKSLTVQSASEVGAIVLGPTGKPVVGAPVQAISSLIPVNPLLVAAGAVPSKPQPATSVVGADGSVVFQADPGIYDVSVRPESSTGFAWFVRPNVSISDGSHELGTLTMPLPVLYAGELVSDAGLLPGSLIRAYVFMDGGGYTADSQKAKSVLQVAETRAESDGTFTLLIPAGLN